MAATVSVARTVVHSGPGSPCFGDPWFLVIRYSSTYESLLWPTFTGPSNCSRLLPSLCIAVVLAAD